MKKVIRSGTVGLDNNVWGIISKILDSKSTTNKKGESTKSIKVMQIVIRQRRQGFSTITFEWFRSVIMHIKIFDMQMHHNIILNICQIFYLYTLLLVRI